MLRRSPSPDRPAVSPLRRRILNTVAIAACGAFAGLGYARYILPESPPTVPGTVQDEARRRTVALYGTTGAIVALLGVRLASVIRTIISGYLDE